MTPAKQREFLEGTISHYDNLEAGEDSELLEMKAKLVEDARMRVAVLHVHDPYISGARPRPKMILVKVVRFERYLCSICFVHLIEIGLPHVF